MSLDLVTLALAKKYADEKVSGGSHGEYATTEYVDTAILENAFYKPAPVDSIEPMGANVLFYYINIEDMENNVSYYFNPKEKENYPDFRTQMGRFYIQCDDGSKKYIYSPSINTKNTYYVEKTYETKWRFYSGNTSYEIDFTDRSTSSSIIVKTKYNAKYLQTDGNGEYIPTTDYSPATKKYVDDSIAAVDSNASLLVTVDVSTMTANYSKTEIINAAKSGKLVYADVMNQLFVLKNIANASFTSVTYMAGTKIDLTSFYIDDDKKVHINVTDIYNVLPSYSSSDYGKYATPSANGLVYKELPSVDLTGYATENYVNDAIANIDIPDNISTDVVQYVEQSLTEEQQMQARANLGLYGYVDEYRLLTTAGPDAPGIVWQLSELPGTWGSYYLEIVDLNIDEVLFGAIFDSIGYSGESLSGGTDLRWYWGNPSLIKNDLEAARVFSEYTENDTGEPIVMYRAINEDEGYNFARLYISPELQPSHWIGLEVNIKSGYPERVYKVIPEEYLPDSVPKDNSLGITGATVGQVAQIKEVDESGIPVAWEPVNNSGWKKLIDYTTPEQTWTPEIPQIVFTHDDDGNPLSATRVYIRITGVITGGVTGRLTINSTNFINWSPPAADTLFCNSIYVEFSQGVYSTYSTGVNGEMKITNRQIVASVDKI